MHGEQTHLGYNLTNTAPCWQMKTSSETEWRIFQVAMKSHLSCVPIPTFMLSLSWFWAGFKHVVWKNQNVLKEIILHAEFIVEVEYK